LKNDSNITLEITGGIYPVMTLFLSGAMFFGFVIGENVGYRVSMITL